MILVVIFEVEFGGAEKYVENMVSVYSRKGIKVDIMTDSHKLLCNVKEMINKFFFIPRNSTYLEIFRIMNKIQWSGYGLVFTHKWNAVNLFGVVCRKMGIPLISVIHSMYYCELEKERGIRKGILHYMNQYCEVVIVVSEACKMAMINAGLQERKVKVIENVAFISSQDSFTYNSNSNHILYVGRLSYEKGVDLFLSAIRQCKKLDRETRINIVGNGNMINQLKDMALKFKIKNIDFWGFQDDVERFYKKAKFVVIPSRREACSLVSLEASKLGIPVIAFATGGLVQNVKDKITGELVECGNVDELSKSIDRLYSSGKLCQKYSDNSLRCLKDTMSVWEKELERIYYEYRK